MLATTLLLFSFLAQGATLTSLTTSLNVWDVVAADVTGDGLVDILAVCSDENSDPLNKEVAIFVSTGAGKFPTKPTHRLPLDPASGSLFVAEVDGEAGKELVVTSSTGATTYSIGNDGPINIASTEFPTFLPHGSREPRFLKNIAVDLDDDGVDEWIVPGLKGYEVRNSIGLVAELHGDVVSEVQPLANVVVSHRLPAIHPFDHEGSSVQGVAFLNNTFADFSYGDDWSQHSRYRIPVKVEDQWDSSTRMADIDHDGFPDLVVTQTQGTVRLKVLTQIYIADKPFQYPKTPTASYEMKGALTTPYFKDVNGDEQLDLIMISVPFGVRAIINFFVRNKVTIKAEVYLFDGSGFPKTPTFKTSLSLEAPDGRDQVAFTMGDFTGDGRLDVAVATGSDRFAIHIGSKNSFLESRPWKTWKVPAFGVARTHDLDGNQRDDLILYHPSGKARKRIDVLVF